MCHLIEDEHRFGKYIWHLAFLLRRIAPLTLPRRRRRGSARAPAGWLPSSRSPSPADHGLGHPRRCRGSAEAAGARGRADACDRRMLRP
jgi:hypothetical protein